MRNRDQYDTVTEIPVLVFSKKGWVKQGEWLVAKGEDGEVWFEGPRLYGNIPVRIFGQKDLDPNSPSGKKAWAELSEEDRNWLLALLEMKGARVSKDKLALERADEHLHREASLVKRRLLAKAFLEEPEKRLAGFLTSGLVSARLVLWWTGKQFVPAVFCMDVKTAICVRSLLGIVGGKALVVCPHCGKPFVQKDSRQNYCSLAHREAHRQRRFRTRAKAHVAGHRRGQKRRQLVAEDEHV